MAKRRAHVKAGPGKAAVDLETHYVIHVQKELSWALWVLRITEHVDKPMPVMIVKQRLLPDERNDTANMKAARSVLKERGLLYGPVQLRCLPIIRAVITRVQDRAGVPLELHRFLEGPRITFRGNMPLDEETGLKLALLFKLQERLKKLDRIELLARRIDRFTREEANYWYSRITSFGAAPNRWAMAGMKLMLAGQPSDPAVKSMLEKLRTEF